MDVVQRRAPRRTSDVRVDAEKRPGWVTGTERPPTPGERVLTHEGTGVIVRVAGRTSTAGRMLEIAMDDGRKPPFFTSDANIMVEREGRPVVAADAANPPA